MKFSILRMLILFMFPALWFGLGHVGVFALSWINPHQHQTNRVEMFTLGPLFALLFLFIAVFGLFLFATAIYTCWEISGVIERKIQTLLRTRRSQYEEPPQRPAQP
jgi:hypothetical protein